MALSTSTRKNTLQKNKHCLPPQLRKYCKILQLGTDSGFLRLQQIQQLLLEHHKPMGHVKVSPRGPMAVPELCLAITGIPQMLPKHVKMLQTLRLMQHLFQAALPLKFIVNNNMS